MSDQDATPGDPPWSKWTGSSTAPGFLNMPDEAALMRLSMAGKRRCRWCAAPMGWRNSGFVCLDNVNPCDG